LSYFCLFKIDLTFKITIFNISFLNFDPMIILRVILILEGQKK
jgi:hypothetical protein